MRRLMMFVFPMAVACGGAVAGEPDAGAPDGPRVICAVGGVSYVGCDGAAHDFGIKFTSTVGGSLAFCWPGQITGPDPFLDCAAGTECVVSTAAGVQNGACQ